MLSLKSKIALVIGVLAVVFSTVLLILWVVFTQAPVKTVASQTFTGYQAVFLANGQVYFGKVTSNTPDQLVLENIFYLKMDQASNMSTLTQNQSDLQLIKLGQELHGPKDKMYINPQQVMFIEDLQDNSKVVQAIDSYNKK